jgi:AcrR family transcriptional regulator
MLGGLMVYRRTERAKAVRAAAQARILSAAGKLFMSKGYDATTMQDIVREADTSIGNAYFYFQNKETLMRALVESSFNTMFDAAEERARRVPEGPARIGTLIAINTTTFLTTRRDMLRVLVADPRAGIIQRIGDIAVERWIGILSSSFPDRPPHQLPMIAAAIWGVNRSIVERISRDVLMMDIKDAVTFMVCWALAALDVPTAQIKRIEASAWRLASRHAREQKALSW